MGSRHSWTSSACGGLGLPPCNTYYNKAVPCSSLQVWAHMTNLELASIGERVRVREQKQTATEGETGEAVTCHGL